MYLSLLWDFLQEKKKCIKLYAILEIGSLYWIDESPLMKCVMVLERNWKRLCIAAKAFLLVMVAFSISAQELKKTREYKKDFQVSLFPGISTNGTGSGFFVNKYSINIFSGLSASNRIAEIGGISNIHLKSSTGFQIAGLANITGANAFINRTLSEEREILGNGYEVNNQGVQLAGLLNYVRDNAAGIQISGGFNFNGGQGKAVQIAGLGNTNAGGTIGLQISGMYNSSGESTAGVQLSSLFNNTNQVMSGTQVALINKARVLRGGKSTPSTKSRGLQIGVVNFCKEMDGWQIGVINFGGASRGKQIGLINFFERNGTKEMVRNGTPIGLLNFGSKGSVIRYSFNELFPINLEYTSGNCLNCTYVIPTEMPYHDSNKIFNQNALILGIDYAKKTWAFGYGFEKILMNKVSMMPKPGNERRMLSYGINFLHLNREMSFDKRFNILTRAHIEYGLRFFGLHIFAGFSFNFLVEEDDNKTSTVGDVKSYRRETGDVFGYSSHIWPGYSIGIQL